MGWKTKGDREMEDKFESACGLFSWWLCLRHAIPWRQLKGRAGKRWERLKYSSRLDCWRRSRRRRNRGSCRYDPLSYALNFEKVDEDDDDKIYRGFSSRFVPIGALEMTILAGNK